MTLDVRLSGIWHFQRITMTCLCRLVTMSRSPFMRGDVWHCDEHGKANVEIVAVAPATLADRERLTIVTAS